MAVHYVVHWPQRGITLKRAQARTAPSAVMDEGPILTMWDRFSDLGELDGHVLDTSGEAEEAQCPAGGRGHSRWSFPDGLQRSDWTCKGRRCLRDYLARVHGQPCEKHSAVHHR